MEKIAFLLKTYRDDFVYVKRLLKSFQKYNCNNIKLYIVLPEKDIFYFPEYYSDKLLFANTEIIYEERLSNYFATSPVRQIRIGYINQSIVKLAFWELEYAENYLPIDSDCEFIRPFYQSDFIAKDVYPFTILIEDNELKVDPAYFYKCDWTGRETLIKNICKAMEYTPDTLLTAHGFCILSSFVLKNLKEKFMKSMQYSYIDLLAISPYEFSWYNMWLQKTNLIPIHFREPLFKTFHTEDQLKWYKYRKISIEDIARGYIGIVVNSNFQPNRGQDNPIDYNTYKSPVLYENPGFKDGVKIVIQSLLLKISHIPNSVLHLCYKVIYRLFLKGKSK